jgi:DNA-binding response OmpR family regulator
VLLGLARDQGFKGLVAMRGSDALSLASEFLPTAVSLDIFLPDTPTPAAPLPPRSRREP